MSDLIVYGASDDLIETGGLLREELNPPYGKPVVVTVLVDDAGRPPGRPTPDTRTDRGELT